MHCALQDLTLSHPLMCTSPDIRVGPRAQVLQVLIQDLFMPIHKVRLSEVYTSPFIRVGRSPWPDPVGFFIQGDATEA